MTGSRPSQRNQTAARREGVLSIGRMALGDFAEDRYRAEFWNRFQQSPRALAWLSLNNANDDADFEAACFAYWLEHGWVEPYERITVRPDAATFRMTRAGRLRVSARRKLLGLRGAELDQWQEEQRGIKD